MSILENKEGGAEVHQTRDYNFFKKNIVLYKNKDGAMVLDSDKKGNVYVQFNNGTRGWVSNQDLTLWNVPEKDIIMLGCKSILANCRKCKTVRRIDNLNSVIYACKYCQKLKVNMRINPAFEPVCCQNKMVTACTGICCVCKTVTKPIISESMLKKFEDAKNERDCARTLIQLSKRGICKKKHAAKNLAPIRRKYLYNQTKNIITMLHSKN